MTARNLIIAHLSRQITQSMTLWLAEIDLLSHLLTIVILGGLSAAVGYG